jgi:hypothetical protein
MRWYTGSDMEFDIKQGNEDTRRIIASVVAKMMVPDAETNPVDILKDWINSHDKEEQKYMLSIMLIALVETLHDSVDCNFHLAGMKMMHPSIQGRHQDFVNEILVRIQMNQEKARARNE